MGEMRHTSNEKTANIGGHVGWEYVGLNTDFYSDLWCKNTPWIGLKKFYVTLSGSQESQQLKLRFFTALRSVAKGMLRIRMTVT